MGQSTHGKNYGSKIFETILRRYHSASMIITVNDYHGNDVINVKGGERQKRGQTWSNVGGQKKKCIPCKRKTFSRYKRIQEFFPESTVQNPFGGFPEITFCTEMQTNK